jgi:hypothetical protein
MFVEYFIVMEFPGVTNPTPFENLVPRIGGIGKTRGDSSTC